MSKSNLNAAGAKVAAAAPIINKLTAENFAFPVLPGRYSYDTPTGTVEFSVTDAGHNSGKQKCYTSPELGITAKPIGVYKKHFGAIINHRDGTAAGLGSGSAGRVLTSDEITNKVLAFSSNLAGKIDAVRALLSRAGVDAAAVLDAIDTPAAVEMYRAAVQADNERAAAAAAERAAAAAAVAAKKRVNDLKARMCAAIVAGDLAAVDAIRAEMAAADVTPAA